MRAIVALSVATAASLYGLYGPTFVPEPPPAHTATSTEQVQPASTIPVSSMPAPSTSERGIVQVLPEVTVTTTTSTTAAVSVGWNGKCVEWWSTAVQMGWPERLLPTLGEVMWNESRCQADATNGKDHGLTQISWHYHADRVHSFGYTKNDLYVPAVNLMVAYDIYQDALNTSGYCGWWPWNPSGNYCKGRS